jgi:peptidoglycan DL-endopeptidase CwlO
VASRSGVAAAGQEILRGQYVRALAATQNDHLDGFRMASAQAKQAKAAFESSRRQAANLASQLDAARNATVAADRQLRVALGQVKGEIATLVAQAEAAKQAEAARQAQQALARQAQQTLARQQAAAQAALAASRSRTPTAAPPPPAPPLPQPPPVPVGSGGAAAVAAARTRLGDPYVWGAVGPNEFDCSGLTMWAWAHAGVSLPHYSGDQYASITHISMADLQPGDLVFPANPGDHVAMYIGGGQVIAAPHSGAVVDIEPLYIGFYVLAGRP